MRALILSISLIFSLQVTANDLLSPGDSGLVYEGEFSPTHYKYWNGNVYANFLFWNIKFEPALLLVSRRIKPYFFNTQMTAQVARLSSSGRDIVVRVKLKNPGFNKKLNIFSNGENEINIDVGLQVSSCDGEDLKGISDRKNPSIDDLIQEFYVLKYNEYLRCDFDMVSVVPEADMIIDQYWQGTRPRLRDPRRSSVRVSTSNNGKSLAFSSGTGDESRAPLTIGLKLVESSRDPEARDRVITNLDQFVSLVKEYGLQIANLQDSNRNQIRLSQETFVEENVPKLAELLAAINSDFGQLTIGEQLAVNIAVQRAYRYVRYFEARLGIRLNSGIGRLLE